MSKTSLPKLKKPNSDFFHLHQKIIKKGAGGKIESAQRHIEYLKGNLTSNQNHKFSRMDKDEVLQWGIICPYKDLLSPDVTTNALEQKIKSYEEIHEELLNLNMQNPNTLAEQEEKCERLLKLVEISEKRKDAQLLRIADLALTLEYLTDDQRQKLLNNSLSEIEIPKPTQKKIAALTASLAQNIFVEEGRLFFFAMHITEQSPEVQLAVIALNLIDLSEQVKEELMEGKMNVHELPEEVKTKYTTLLAKIIHDIFVKEGRVVFFALHIKPDNPHMHWGELTRLMTPQGVLYLNGQSDDPEGGLDPKKDRQANTKKALYERRERISQVMTEDANENGINATFPHRNNKFYGITKIKKIHYGQGSPYENDIKEINKMIKTLNQSEKPETRQSLFTMNNTQAVIADTVIKILDTIKALNELIEKVDADKGRTQPYKYTHKCLSNKLMNLLNYLDTTETFNNLQQFSAKTVETIQQVIAEHQKQSETTNSPATKHPLDEREEKSPKKARTEEVLAQEQAQWDEPQEEIEENQDSDGDFKMPEPVANRLGWQ